MAREMKGAFFDFVPPCATAVRPFLSNSDAETYLSDEARNAALAAWAELIQSARKGAEQRGQTSGIPRELLTTALDVIMTKQLEEEEDAELLSPLTSSLA